jgi:hypothetical protein
MGKSTISMAIFNSYVSHYQRVMGTIYQVVQDLFSISALKGIAGFTMNFLIR